MASKDHDVGLDPDDLASFTASWIRKKWEFSPDQSGTFTLAVVLQQPAAK